jgi:hypothetical protein
MILGLFYFFVYYSSFFSSGTLIVEPSLKSMTEDEFEMESLLWNSGQSGGGGGGGGYEKGA